MALSTSETARPNRVQQTFVSTARRTGVCDALSPGHPLFTVSRAAAVLAESVRVGALDVANTPEILPQRIRCLGDRITLRHQVLPSVCTLLFFAVLPVVLTESLVESEHGVDGQEICQALQPSLHETRLNLPSPHSEPHVRFPSLSAAAL